MRGEERRRAAPLALGVAVGIHAALLLVTIHWPAPVRPPAAPADRAPPIPAPRATAVAVSLIDGAALGELLEARPGPFDAPAPGDGAQTPGRVDRAGVSPAAAGGGHGGALRITRRRDREDQRAEIWNGKARPASPAAAPRRRRVASLEAVARQRRPGFSDHTDRGPRARRGAARGSRRRPGLDHPESWRDTEPVAEARPDRPEAIRGRQTAVPAAALSDRGEGAVDVPRRGERASADDAVAASRARDPAPFELAHVAAGGGPGREARGRGGAGPAPRGAGRGVASRRVRRRGDGGEAIRATRGDPYFRAMYRELDRRVVFPRELARRLEQGTVVVRFRLNPDGRVSAITVTKSSGFEQFDRALVGAIERAKGFGRVPAAMLDGAHSIQVRVPYKFSNPLIR